MHKEPLNDLYALLKVLPTGKLCLTPLCVSTWAWDCSALYWPGIRTVLVLGENSTIRITAITGLFGEGLLSVSISKEHSAKCEVHSA